jgi:RHS repeat-associated protein
MGHLTQAQSLAASGDLTLQSITYNPDYTIATTSSPAFGTTVYGYDPITRILSEVRSPNDVVASVLDRDPLTDAILSLQIDNGSTPLEEYFRYDGFERLSSHWNNLGSASELNPNELLSYRYAAGNLPAAVYSSVLVDANGGAARSAVAYLTAGGEPIGSAAAIPEGWSFGPITERLRATRSQNTYLRPSLSTGTDPLSLDYASLLTDKTRIGTLASTAEGGDASRTTLLHAGVERQLVTEQVVSGGQVLESTVENGAFAMHRTLDAHKRTVAYQDEAGVEYRFTYDALGRVRRVKLPDGKRHDQSFDGHGRVAWVWRDGIASVQSEYDATTGLPTRKTYFSPEGAGQRKVEYGYDAIGRKTLETYTELGSSQTKRYQYYYDGATPSTSSARNDLGQLSAVTGDGYSKLFTHRPDGSLASRIAAVDGFPTIKLELAYYEDGSPHKQTITQLDGSGNALSTSERVLGVDSYGRLKDVKMNGSALVTATYNGNGLLWGGNFPNGDRVTFTYDETTRRLTGSSQVTGSYGVSTLQQLNARGLVDWERMEVGATRLTRDFSYSPNGQRFLTGAVDAQNSYAYGFDGFGLPTFVTTNRATRNIVETATTLTAGSVTYGFDALHRTVSRTDPSAPGQELALAYGPDGQVATATKGGVTYQFRYDEDGQRLAKFTGTTPTAAYLPEGYLDSTGLTERFALGGRTVGIIKNGDYTTIGTDLRGSVLAETTGVACVASPFGQRDVHPAMAAAIDYVEKGYDADLGWVRMGVRDYWPNINRFTTADPLYLEKPEKCVNNPLACTRL